MRIVQALVSDAPEILSLQKLAYRSEALLYHDFNIPPLIQTLEELERDFKVKTFIKAERHGTLIGAVNAYLRGDNCLVGRHMVHPEYQGRGVGKRLMAAVEQCFPDAASYQLFTGEKSERSIGLYRSLGYEIVRYQAIPGSFGLLFMEKVVQPPSSGKGSPVCQSKE